MGELSTSLNLSSYLAVSSWSKRGGDGGDSSCSWVLVHALGLIVKEEFKSVMLGGGNSQVRSTHTGRIQILSFSTVFIVTPETGDDKCMKNQQLMQGAHT